MNPRPTRGDLICQHTTNLLREQSPMSLSSLTSDGEGAGLEAEKGEEGTIHAPFDPEKIDVITQARTVDLLVTRLREGELDLSPEFQRRSNVWNEARKSALIESLLLRIPIPSLYVSEDKEGNYSVVDGLQRLCVRPRERSRSARRCIWVVLPDPSMPSKVIKIPRDFTVSPYCNAGCGEEPVGLREIPQ